MHESPWHETMMEMQALGRTLPEEPLWSATLARGLAGLVTDLDSDLTAQQRTLLVRVGSIFARRAADETMAAVEASIMIDRAKALKKAP